MPVVGAIADRARGLIPVTWDALENDERYGDAPLQTVINTAKEAVLGSVVATGVENTYPLVVVDYVAKMAVLDLIPAAIDFWMNEPISESATGTEEVHTFTERVEALKHLQAELLKETRAKAADIAALVGFVRVISRQVPRINTMDDDFLTPSPQEFPRPYQPTAFT